MTKLFLEPQEPRFAVKNYPFRGIKSQKHEKSVATSKRFDPIVASLVSKSGTCNEHELLSHVVSIYLRVDKNFELLRHRNM